MGRRINLEIGELMFRNRFQLVGDLLVASAAIALVSLLQVAAPAQQPIGTTVQLPVVKQFNVSTAVSVPDGGTLHLGGVTRHRASSSSSGIPGLAGPLSRPFSNRSGSVSTSSSNASLKVRILSTREMSQDVLAAARASRPANYEQVQALNRKASFLTRNIGRNRNR